MTTKQKKKRNIERARKKKTTYDNINIHRVDEKRDKKKNTKITML